jgi:hypothetical protein
LIGHRSVSPVRYIQSPVTSISRPISKKKKKKKKKKKVGKNYKKHLDVIRCESSDESETEDGTPEKKVGFAYPIEDPRNPHHRKYLDLKAQFDGASPVVYRAPIMHSPGTIRYQYQGAPTSYINRNLRPQDYTQEAVLLKEPRIVTETPILAQKIPADPRIEEKFKLLDNHPHIISKAASRAPEVPFSFQVDPATGQNPFAQNHNNIVHTGSPEFRKHGNKPSDNESYHYCHDCDVAFKSSPKSKNDEQIYQMPYMGYQPKPIYVQPLYSTAPYFNMYHDPDGQKLPSNDPKVLEAFQKKPEERQRDLKKYYEKKRMAREREMERRDKKKEWEQWEKQKKKLEMEKKKEKPQPGLKEDDDRFNIMDSESESD